MSDYKAGDLLASLSPDEREALLRRVSEILKPKTKTVRDVPAPDTRRYWHVKDGYDGYFQTVVDYRDILSIGDGSEQHAAYLTAQQSLQPWYYIGPVGKLACYGEIINHDKYVEWLRRHY